MNWFLYDRNLRHERIEQLNENCQYRFSYLSLDLGKLLMLQSLLQSSEYISVSWSGVLLQLLFIHFMLMKVLFYGNFESST